MFPRTATVSVPPSSFYRPPNAGCHPPDRKREDLVYRSAAAHHRRHVAGTVNPALFSILSCCGSPALTLRPLVQPDGPPFEGGLARRIAPLAVGENSCGSKSSTLVQDEFFWPLLRSRFLGSLPHGSKNLRQPRLTATEHSLHIRFILKFALAADGRLRMC